VEFEPDEDQRAVLDGLEQLLAGADTEPPKEGVFTAFNATLDSQLAESGFLQIAREQGFSLLEAALVVERIAHLPVSVEAAASALIVPLLPEDCPRPVALANQLRAPARFLPQAATLLSDEGDTLSLIRVNADNVEPIETLFAYPYGRLIHTQGVELRALGPTLVAAFRRRWRLAIAVEGAGLLQAALDEVVEHVKARHQFGRPLGSFQAVQHRLAMAASTAAAVRALALRAAWSDDEADCAVAATYLQDAIPRVTYDLHQFCGAMGLTLEFKLHHWTYRLKALLGELGGSSAQARGAAIHAWPGKN